VGLLCCRSIKVSSDEHGPNDHDERARQAPSD